MKSLWNLYPLRTTVYTVAKYLKLIGHLLEIEQIVNDSPIENVQ